MISPLNFQDDLIELWLLSGESPGVFDHIIVNDDLEAAAEKLKGILIEVCWNSLNNFCLEFIVEKEFIV